jgi:5-methylcytosine-specific restriction endonuclease McrA
MRATSCDIARYHRPTPLRFVMHHIMPQVCGGKTEPANLTGLCDSCHYTVHALLYQLKLNGPEHKLVDGTRRQKALAMRGYLAAVAGGTVDKIPDEGA